MSTLGQEVKVDEHRIKAIVLHNAVETDLDVGTSYRSNKTVLVVPLVTKVHSDGACLFVLKGESSRLKIFLIL